MRFLDALGEILQNTPPTTLRKAQQFLSTHYRERATSQSIYDQAPLAYLATRCPATFAAARAVLQRLKSPIHSLLDLGAGPGTATWAAREVFPELQTAHLFEHHPIAVQFGKQIADQHSFQPTWHAQSLERIETYPSADLAILSYSLGELKNPLALLTRLRHIPFLALIEPGTPRGYATLLRARDHLLSLGAHLLAPCPHAHPCPLKGDDWCHFSIRLPRTSIHRYLKDATLGYEDEKYSYLLFSHAPVVHEHSRILRHPQKHSGHIRLVLCTPEGKQEEKVVTRSKKEDYKRAKDAKWGENF